MLHSPLGQREAAARVLEYAAMPAFWWFAIFQFFTLCIFLRQMPKEKGNKRNEEGRMADAGTQTLEDEEAGEPSSNILSHQHQEAPVPPNHSPKEEENIWHARTNPHNTIFLHPYLSSTVVKVFATLAYGFLFLLLLVQTAWVIITVYRFMVAIFTGWPFFINFTAPSEDGSRGRWNPILAALVWIGIQFLYGIMFLVALVFGLGVVMLCFITNWYPVACIAEVVSFNAEVIECARREREARQNRVEMEPVTGREEDDGGEGQKLEGVKVDEDAAGEDTLLK